MTDIFEFDDQAEPVEIERAEIEPVSLGAALVEAALDIALGAIDDDVPPAGTACASCKSLGHWCAAKCYRGEDTPLCRACADGVDCSVVAAKLRRVEEDFFVAMLPGRHDNPVSPVRNVTPVDPAKRVVVPTPEELKRNFTGRAVGVDAPDMRSMPAAQERQLIVKPKRERLMLTAPAEVESEPIEPEADEKEVEKESEPMAFATVTEAIIDEIRKASLGENNSELGRRLNIHNATVFYYRKKFKKESSSPRLPAVKKTAAKKTAPKKKAALTIQGGASIDIVGVAERIHAMAPASSGAVTLSVTFTDAGVDAWWAKLSLVEKVKLVVANVVF